MNIFSFFRPKINNYLNADPLDQIISYTKSIVLREDLIKNILERLKNYQSDGKKAPISIYIQTYLSLEEFIIQNKPLVVQKAFTRESLREEIRNKFNILGLPSQFRLYFLPDNEQLLQVYSGFTKLLEQYIANQIGPNGLTNIIKSAAEGTAFEHVFPINTRSPAEIKKFLGNMTPEQIRLFYKKINSALYKNISNSFGENTALQLTTDYYQKIREMYSYDLITLFLQVMPAGVLETERVTFMTRDDLEKQAVAAAQEKLRRQTAEKSAQSLEAKLLASVSGLSLGFILTDTDNSIITINDAAKKILHTADIFQKISQIEELMNHVFDFEAIIEKCKLESAPIEFNEVEWNGIFLHVTISPIFITNPNREYIGSVILIEDITIEKKLERTKDEFFAIASHELRTPLTAIRGSVSILKSDYADKMGDGDIPTLIGFIDQSANRLIEIVNEFLNVSRIEQGRIVFKMEDFSLSELIIQVINELQNLAEIKHIFLRFENRDNNLNQVYADRDRTKQVLVNLIGNAVKFTEKGGITITTEIKDNFSYVRIQDTGMGISARNQKFLFRKFQQAEEDILTHDASKGTGLGLYICKKFIENMNGKIFLEKSAEKEGSTFTFALPRSAGS